MADDNYIKLMMLFDKRRIIELLQQEVNYIDRHKLVDKLYEEENRKLFEQLQERIKEMEAERSLSKQEAIFRHIKFIHKKLDKIYDLYKDIYL